MKVELPVANLSNQACSQAGITLTNVGLLKPHLTREDAAALIEAARGKTRREVAKQVAALNGDASQAPRAPIVRAVAADRLEITFQIGDTTYEKLQRAKGLLSHAIPDGDIGTIIDRALSLLLRDLERSKYAATDRPRRPHNPIAGSRAIPAWVRRAVWKRDGGRCAFVGPRGRCTETAFLEFHHVIPFATGGRSTVENIELRCRAHNQREAELYFGAAMPSEVRERAVPYGLGPDLVGECKERGPSLFAMGC